jgi:hypothetical protein
VVVAWVLFPMVVLAVCLGCGLLVERLGGWILPGGLLPAVGLALVFVVATLTTSKPSTAPRTTLVIVVLAAAGYLSSLPRVRSLRPDPWAVAVVLGVFAVCAAPVVVSGNATFLGYSAVHFALADQLVTYGHSLSRLSNNSAYSLTLHNYLGTAYPPGVDAALGGFRTLVAQDVAWIFQPYMATMLAFGGAALYELLRGIVGSRPFRAACAFIAAQPGLVYAFYIEASVKEVATTLILTTTVVLLFETLGRLRLRGVIPLAVVVLAGLDVLELAIVPWLGPPVAFFLVAVAWRARHRVRAARKERLALGIGAVAVVLGALAAPIVGQASTFFSTASSVLTQKGVLGGLAAPLPRWEMLGIWPTGDFRFPQQIPGSIVYVLIGIAIGSAVVGVVWLLRRRAFAPLLLLASDGIAAGYLLTRASPYAAAKVMMIFSVSALLLAVLGAAALYNQRSLGWRLAGCAVLAVVGGGVLWTNALAFRDSSVAPRGRLEELAHIGSRFKGQGPAFFNLSDEFATYFLRREDPTVTFQFPVIPRRGLPPRSYFQTVRIPYDTNDIAPSYLQQFHLLVIGRSPRWSQPPANFRIVYRGRYYDVWKRTSSPHVLQHVSMGPGLFPYGVPSCTLVMSTAAKAAHEHARLVYAAAKAPPTLVPTASSRPPDWPVVEGDPTEVIPRQPAAVMTGTIGVSQAGRYEIWLDGSFGQRFVIKVDGRTVGSVANQLGPFDQALRIGTVTLRAGPHPVEISRPPGGINPNHDDANPNNRLIGPLMLVPDGSTQDVHQVSPARARSLCGRSLNWLEIVT